MHVCAKGGINDSYPICFYLAKYLLGICIPLINFYGESIDSHQVSSFPNFQISHQVSLKIYIYVSVVIKGKVLILLGFEPMRVLEPAEINR